MRRRREQLAGSLELVWVAPDLLDATAKPCMGGWGAVSLTVAPDGTALPCPSAATLPALDAPNVRAHRLDWIWRQSKAFNAYRGEAWNRPRTCRGCALRATDFGGCRCQAYALTGDAPRTDPACRHMPHPTTTSSARSSTQAPLEELRLRLPRGRNMRRRLRAALMAGVLTTAGLTTVAATAPPTPLPRGPVGRPAAAQDWSVALIDSTMARYTPSTIGGWSYPVGLYLYGQYLTYQRTHDARYLTYIKSYVDRFVSSDGSIGQSFNSLDSMQAAAPELPGTTRRARTATARRP